MRHKGDNNEWKSEQDAEIMGAYRRLFAAYGGLVSVGQLYELVAFSPASRFFVSERQATRTVGRMMCGERMGRMRNSRLRMYREICRRTVALLEARPHYTLLSAVSEVVRQPAPEMYVSPRQVSAIIDKERKKCYETRKQRLRHSF